jgi:cytochrome b involved in lipid metabolism
MKKIIWVLIVIAVGYGIWSLTTSTPVPTPNQDGTTSAPVESISPAAGEQATPAPTAKTFTMAQVATHKDATSCYTVVRGNVYDLTSWISQHPGGEKAILGLCGKDGTAAFVNQHGGRPRQENELATFQIGTLTQ